MKTNMSYEFWRDLNFECLVARTCKAWRGLEKLCTRWRNFENGTGGYRAEDAAPYRYCISKPVLWYNGTKSLHDFLVSNVSPLGRLSIRSRLLASSSSVVSALCFWYNGPRNTYSVTSELEMLLRFVISSLVLWYNGSKSFYTFQQKRNTAFLDTVTVRAATSHFWSAVSSRRARLNFHHP